MQRSNSYGLSDRAAETYERQKVRSIFRPLAEATLSHLSWQPDGPILDVACGTGIMSRVLRERFGPALDITGADMNPAMIAVARATAPETDPGLNWHVAPADDLGLPSGHFGTCFCQQGIQYFPDETAAIAEIKRILVPGGRIVLSVWAGPSPYFVAQARAMEAYFGRTAGQKALAPFAYSGEERLPPLLEATGFSEIDIKTVSIQRVIEDARRGIFEDIMGSPLAEFASSDDSAVDDVVVSILDDCRKFMRGGDLTVLQTSMLVTAMR